MPLIAETIPNLLNGISQQPHVLRLPTQGDLQINGYSSAVDGLQKRPPTEHVAKLRTGVPTHVFTHVIERDLDERYLLLITPGNDPQVFDADTGEEKTVTNNAAAYIDSDHADYHAVTVNDFTFVINKRKTVALTADLTTAQVNEAFVTVRQAVEKTNYAIDIDGSQVASFTTGAAGADNVETQEIATELRSDLTSLTGFTATREGSTIHIKRDNGAAFTINVRDGYGNLATQLAFLTVQRFTDLPQTCRDGAVMKVSGDADSGFDDYYVQFVADGEGPSALMGRGRWVETVAPGITYKFDKATMPHVLVRESNGTFTWRQATELLDREVGDTLTNIQPSFIGNTLQYVFFHQNRLGLLSADSLILSEAGEFFNFWRTTALEVIDSDPIDIAANNQKVSLLLAAKSFNSELHVFGDQVQFRVDTGGALLSPKTVELKTTTTYQADLENCDVELVGRSVFFPYRDGQFAGVREYALQADIDAIDAPSVTEHVAKYIPGVITRMTAGSHESVMCCLSSEAVDSIYVFKWYGAQNQRLQTSWSLWNYCFPATIKDLTFLDDTLLIVVQLADGLYLEKMQLSLGRTDENNTFLTYLDRRWAIDEEDKVYDPVTNTTTITLPYALPGDATDTDLTECCIPVVVERECLDSEEAMVTTTTTSTTAAPTTTTTTATPLDNCTDCAVAMPDHFATIAAVNCAGSTWNSHFGDGSYTFDSYTSSWTFTNSGANLQFRCVEGRLQARLVSRLGGGAIIFGEPNGTAQADYRDVQDSISCVDGRFVGTFNLEINSNQFTNANPGGNDTCSVTLV